VGKKKNRSKKGNARRGALLLHKSEKNRKRRTAHSSVSAKNGKGAEFAKRGGGPRNTDAE